MRHCHGCGDELHKTDDRREFGEQCGCGEKLDALARTMERIQALLSEVSTGEPDYDDWGGDTDAAESWGMEQGEWELAQRIRAAIAKGASA